MLGDLIAAIFIHRKPLFVPHTSNLLKHSNYLSRIRDFHAAAPDEYFRRYQAGLKVQMRSSLGKQANLSNVVKLRKKTSKF